MSNSFFGPGGYENFFVLDCQKLPEFEASRAQLIADIKEFAFGFERDPSRPREFCVLVASANEKDKSTLRANAPFVSTKHGVVHFLNEPKIEVWPSYNERVHVLLARAFNSFIASHDVTIISDWGDDLTKHYRKHPWELFLGR